MRTFAPSLDSDFWKRLLHRWFVQYNPLYVVSAALVLLGVNLLSRGLVGETIYAQFGVAAIAEVYSWALIAAAAWLMRTGSRRPAVMLALLVAIYQCDPTLHTESCAYLGFPGAIGAAAWLANFVAKLYGLLWALRLRISHSALAVTTLGASGLVILPRAFAQLELIDRGVLISSWVFLLFTAAFWSSRKVESRLPLDEWAQTVLRRGTRATWAIFGVLTLSHVYFWMSEFDVNPLVLLPVAVLLTTRWMYREAAVWFTAFATLFAVGLTAPGYFYATASFAALVLALRGLREPTEAGFKRASRAAVARLLTGAFSALYLAGWTVFWKHGAWPGHVLGLDVFFATFMVLVAWHYRVPIALVPVGALTFGLARQRGWLFLPSSTLGWGIASVGTGFGLLLTALVATWRLRSVDWAITESAWPTSDPDADRVTDIDYGEPLR